MAEGPGRRESGGCDDAGNPGNRARMRSRPVGAPHLMIRRTLDALYLWAGYAAGLFLIAIFLLMMGMSVGREIGLNIPAGDDFASWCMAAMAFLGLAHTFKSGDMIRVGLLIDRFQGRSRWVFEVFSLVLGLGFSGFFAWHAAIMTWQSWQFNDVAGGVVPMPLWIPQLGYSGGLIILFIAMLDEFVHVVIRGQEPRYEKPPAKSDEEIVERAMASGV